MNTYETIPTTVEAFQAPLNLNVPSEVSNGTVIDTKAVKKDDWVVTQGGIVIEVLTTDQFFLKYRRPVVAGRPCPPTNMNDWVKSINPNTQQWGRASILNG